MSVRYWGSRRGKEPMAIPRGVCILAGNLACLLLQRGWPCDEALSNKTEVEVLISLRKELPFQREA